VYKNTGTVRFPIRFAPAKLGQQNRQEIGHHENKILAQPTATGWKIYSPRPETPPRAKLAHPCNSISYP
jgi:hypothetical protein